jgi:CHAT domain-containing protein
MTIKRSQHKKNFLLLSFLLLFQFSIIAQQNWAELNSSMLKHINSREYEQAIQYGEKAIKEAEKEFGKYHQNYYSTLNLLYASYSITKQELKALALAKEVVEVSKELFGKEDFRHVLALNVLGENYKDFGEYDKALSYFQKALKSTEEHLSTDHPIYQGIMISLSGLYRIIGEYEKSLALQRKVIEMAEKTGRKDFSYGFLLTNLAGLYREMDRMEEALTNYIDAYELMIKIIKEETFIYSSEADKENLMVSAIKYFELIQSFLYQYSDQNDNVGKYSYDIELQLKGLILKSSIKMRERIQGSGNKEALELFDEWLNLKDLITKEYTKPEVIRIPDLEKKEYEAESIESNLNRISNSFRDVNEMDQPKWKDVQNKINENEVAIEFTAFPYSNSKNETDSVVYCALVLKDNSEEPLLVKLFEQKQLDSIFLNKGYNTDNYIASLYRGAKKANENQTSNGKALYDLIWKPIEKYLEGTKTVYFSPSGSLHRIAFAALPVNDNELLSDRYKLHQLSSTGKLVVEKNTIDAKNIKDVALFGGIQYDLSQEDWVVKIDPNQTSNADLAMRGVIDQTSRGNSWNYLPGTLTEIEEIGKLLDKNKINYTSYTQSNALEENIKKLSGTNSPSVLHIATHGFFFEDVVEKNTVDLNNPTSNVYNASKNPLHRAGLLFAGANAAWTGEPVPEGAEDGILSAYEASHIPLNNTKLVVLSACETGLGEIQGSEGVFGLQRAFKGAGAEYLLMSLWKVPDAETAEFMNYFYENWLSGMHIRDAFLETQERMKKNHPDDPYVWAAFVMLR